MIKTIFLKDRYIKYELTRKNVKNINLRIKSDCNICVSANYFVSEKAVNNFLFKKADLIIKALEKYSKRISSYSFIVVQILLLIVYCFFG